MTSLQQYICMFFQHFIMENNKRRNILSLKITRQRRKMWDKIRHLQRMQRTMLMKYMTMFPIVNIFEMYMDMIQIERSIWMKSRSNHFWSEIILCTYTDSD